MPAFVALLRGINVGKANRIRMEELRELLAGLGYSNIATLLNSGNAVFRAPRNAPAKHAADIAATIHERLKIEIPIVVKTADELRCIVEQNPLKVDSSAHSRLLIALVQDSRRLPEMTAIEPLLEPAERFAIGKHAAYLFCATGILESKALQALLARADRSATTRNWTTILKLLALAGAGVAVDDR